jgi:hypothetical protein
MSFTYTRIVLLAIYIAAVCDLTVDKYMAVPSSASKIERVRYIFIYFVSCCTLHSSAYIFFINVDNLQTLSVLATT